jgi:thioredoxin reductase
MFGGMTVAVVGAGNSAFEGALQLAEYADKVYIIARRDEFRAHPSTIEKISANAKIEIVSNTVIKEVQGEAFLEKVVLENVKNGEISELALQGIFIEIGAIPNTDILKDLVELDEIGAVKIDPLTQQTSHKNIWAAGDCTNILYHQNNIAVGDAVKALEDIFNNLKAK